MYWWQRATTCPLACSHCAMPCLLIYSRGGEDGVGYEPKGRDWQDTYVLHQGKES